ncbi:MAG: D-alanine--D-alanine ligase [Deltaproteobacteria bacterium]|nr:D-alanine--D-alanine ligase [Deltaproteobacteria bacterium]
MNVGLTYDLRRDYLAMGFDEEDVAEFDNPGTVDGLEQALQDLGYQTDRIGHLRGLVGRLAAGDRWDVVFNIAEGMGGFGRESQIPALLEAYGIPYTFSDPLTLAVTLHKGMAKHIVRDLGLPTPDFAVVDSEADLDSVRLPFPLFAKPVAEGSGKGISAASRIDNYQDLTDICRSLLARHKQPVLVETFLPGREFTVGVVGQGKTAQAIGVMEIILLDTAEPGAYSYYNKEHSKEDQGGWVVTCKLVNDDQAREAGRVALAAWRGLGCRDAGRVDLRADERGRPNFIEVNPLAGLNPDHSDLPILCRLVGRSYQSLIAGIMDSALTRTGREDDRSVRSR